MRVVRKICQFGEVKYTRLSDGTEMWRFEDHSSQATREWGWAITLPKLLAELGEDGWSAVQVDLGKAIDQRYPELRRGGYALVQRIVLQEREEEV